MTFTNTDFVGYYIWVQVYVQVYNQLDDHFHYQFWNWNQADDQVTGKLFVQINPIQTKIKQDIYK